MDNKSDILVALGVAGLLISCGTGNSGGDAGSGLAGAGGGLAGAGGGTAGGGVGGGAGGAPTFEPRVAVDSCSATVSSPNGAVVLDTTITCAQASSGSLALAPNARGFVVFGSTDASMSSVVTVETAGAISAVRGPSQTAAAQVAADAGGGVYLQTYAPPGSGSGIVFHRLDAQGWWRETVDPASATPPLLVVGRTRFGGDGRAHLAYYPYDGTLRVATRASAGTWSSTTFPIDAPLFDLAIDALARPHLVFVTDATVGGEPRIRAGDWLTDTTLPTSLYVPAFEVAAPISAAPANEGGVATAVSGRDGIHIFAVEASRPSRHLILSNTPKLAVTGCPPLPPGGNMPATPCHDTGDGVVSVALAATTRGLWLAYLWHHVDQDNEQSCFPFESSSICRQVTTADRSTAEIVLVRLPADGDTAPPAIAWRMPTPRVQWDSLRTDAAAKHIVFAVPQPTVAAAGPLRYVLLDVEKL